MSRVYFHSPSGDAELLGSERAHLGQLAKATAMGRVAGSPLRFRSLLPSDHYLNRLQPDRPEAWASYYETALRTGSAVIEYRGQSIESFALLLNTALESGDDALVLAARIDGQCEIHGWVDGPNRAWLADKMQAAVDCGTFRQGFWADAGPDGGRVWSVQGWDGVIALLRSQDDEPVVMSYSVCEGFPNPTAAGVVSIEDDPDDEFEDARATFNLLPRLEQWAACMAELRTGVNGLEFKPDNWEEFRFVHRLSMLDLMADDWEERVREAAEWMAAAASA